MDQEYYKWKKIDEAKHSMIRTLKCDLLPLQLYVLFVHANMHLNCVWNYEILSTLNKNNSFRTHEISSGWPIEIMNAYQIYFFLVICDT